MRKIKAFTLIEILFFVAIMGVVASLGFSFLQRQAQQSKVEKTILQIQQVLQAGMSYYVDNNCWPGLGKNSLQRGCNTKKPPDFTNYIPVGTTQTPWGHTYKWQVVGTGDSLFEVSVDMPNRSLAERVLNGLPVGVLGKSGDTKCGENCIKLQTTIPVQSGSGGGIINVVSVGTASVDTSKHEVVIDRPKCPAYASKQVVALTTRSITYVVPDSKGRLDEMFTSYFDAGANVCAKTCRGRYSDDKNICFDYEVLGRKCEAHVMTQNILFEPPYDYEKIICGNYQLAVKTADVDYVVYCCRPGFCEDIVSNCPATRSTEGIDRVNKAEIAVKSDRPDIAAKSDGAAVKLN